jgi:predicted acetyltransferase
VRLVAATLEPPPELEAMLLEIGDGESGFIGDHIRHGPQSSIASYLHRLQDNDGGMDMPGGMVPETTFWLLDDADRLVGTTRLRHLLTPEWRAWCGHIDYYVRPGERGKGYGHAALTLTLNEARELGLNRVLVTVETTNERSLRVVERQGGRLEDERVLEADNVPYRRYWINVRR